MERIVSGVLRKIVRKYNSKSPEVIAVAVESPTGVLADEINGKLSVRSHAFGISSLRKLADNKGAQRGRQKEEGESPALLGSILEQELKDEDEAANSTMFEDFSAIGAEPDAILKSFVGSPAVQHLGESKNSLLLPQKELIGLTKSKLKSSKPVKRSKWKPEEIKQLLKLRRELHSRFQVHKGRTALWEKISSDLLSHGINRSPGQCKYLWATLVQKYEESRSDEKNCERWPYFDEMYSILSDLETTVPTISS